MKTHLSRRSFCGGAALFGVRATALPVDFDIRAIEQARVLADAAEFLQSKPQTITSFHSKRSAGGKHDFFSEGDYWWPDPKHPKGPYIQRDGMSNPENFNMHREVLLRLSVEMPTLSSAWLLTRQREYSDHAAAHLRAWFVTPQTLMNPSLQYAQAIHGRFTGRGIGIIDTIHLAEVFRAASIIEQSGSLSKADVAGLHHWVEQYLTWLNKHQYGKDERDAKNNHGTCWTFQVAAFADYVDDKQLQQLCRERFKTIHLPTQMAPNGSFPLELKRTKPYNYSLFNLEAMAGICQMLSSKRDNLWTYKTADGKGMAKGLEFLAPFIADKSKWPYPPDVMYFDNWPMRQESLLFGGIALDRSQYLDIWKSLDPKPKSQEAIRNFPLRQPLLWLPA